ncbi:M14 family metallopeptidase [Gramella sp. GC03-9]|uniref:M14 family metallopeptidase n=1 Tax=Christiangramia oceanisediminis TaxID=2920386 RepID=A0A9X2KZY1_9FLAO|nr:M14 metallopeptidase family protein [Gramella oceanisediminis]MCP9201455.1 M14 family metallopeptidase [Gramella oceanisediminis]
MNKKLLGLHKVLLLILMIPNSIFSQIDSDHIFYENYETYKTEDLDQRRFKHQDIQPLIDNYRTKADFEVRKVGESIEGRSLDLISFGKGDIDVFLWSQMHGDESTATIAIFDILNFLDSEKDDESVASISENLRVHFLPMLNPDGAEEFTRRNALGIDVNRDALRLQSPEAKTLKRVRDSLEADFGFNLHDQSRYYNAERTDKPATISFLAPAYNYEKDINEVRGNAMKLIVVMNDVLQKYAPGQVGRYNDDFEPRAFGDNIQKWGTSTVLIESGGFPGDREKQEIRKLNFVAILSALKSIATGAYSDADIAQYEEIPNNDRMLFDLKLEAVKYELNGKEYVLDLGINLYERDLDDNTSFYYSAGIIDQGDLSTSYGYENFDASGYKLEFGKIYSEVLKDTTELSNLDVKELLKKGVAYIRMEKLPEQAYTDFPINLVSREFEVSKTLQPGMNACFFLTREGKVEFVVMNGFLSSPENAELQVENALIFR